MVVEDKVSKTRNLFTIPVFPHVKKFILKSTRASGAIKVEENTMLGKIVTLALLDNSTRDGNNDASRRATASVTLTLTKRQVDLRPGIIKLMRINVDIDRVFKDHLLTTIYSLADAGIPSYQACRMFLGRYNINESEYSTDVAYRFFQRSKERTPFRINYPLIRG